MISLPSKRVNERFGAERFPGSRIPPMASVESR